VVEERALLRWLRSELCERLQPTADGTGGFETALARLLNHRGTALARLLNHRKYGGSRLLVHRRVPGGP
jgi:hypothetical protein